MKRGQLLFLCGAFGVFAWACNGILGIEEAKVDPSLSGPVKILNECGSYCDNIMKNCTGLNQEYPNRDTCMAMCSHFDVGLDGDQSGDNRACRVYHTSAATTDPDTHCRHAGALGGNHCGKVCKAFCLQEQAICGTTAYADEEQCRSLCATYPYETTNAGDISIQDGPTLNCRFYHLQSAISDPNTHCAHTSLKNVHCTPPDSDGGADADAANPIDSSADADANGDANGASDDAAATD